MPWHRLDDGFARHEKVQSLLFELADCPSVGVMAAGVWVLMCSECARLAGEGTTRLSAIRQITGLGREDATTAADLLVEAGLWENDGQGYRFHDWEFYRYGGILHRRERANARKQKSRGKPPRFDQAPHPNEAGHGRDMGCDRPVTMGRDHSVTEAGHECDTGCDQGVTAGSINARGDPVSRYQDPGAHLPDSQNQDPRERESGEDRATPARARAAPPGPAVAWEAARSDATRYAPGGDGVGVAPERAHRPQPDAPLDQWPSERYRRLAFTLQSEPARVLNPTLREMLELDAPIDTLPLAVKLTVVRAAWEAQERLRQHLGGRRTPLDERPNKTAQVLIHRFSHLSPQQLQHAVLVAHAEAEAKRDAGYPDPLEYFNGANNWREESVQRALGRTPEQAAAAVTAKLKRATKDRELTFDERIALRKAAREQGQT